MRTKIIQAPRLPLILTLHHPPTIEASTCRTKRSCLFKIFTQLDPLPSNLLNNIGMWNAGIVNCNQPKRFLVWLTQHNPVLSAYTSYKLKKVHTLGYHPICVGGQTPWTSHIQTWPKIVKIKYDQTWACIMSHDYSRPVKPVNTSSVFYKTFTTQINIITHQIIC